MSNVVAFLLTSETNVFSRLFPPVGVTDQRQSEPFILSELGQWAELAARWNEPTSR